MIILTGAAGFIASCVAAGLADLGLKDIVLVDDFSRKDKEPNHLHRACLARVQREDLLDWMEPHANEITAIIHLGARTDTAEMDWNVFLRLNLLYSKAIWNFCVEHQIPLIYASSAATYGDGSLGFDDDHALIPQLKPLNPYGQSKQDFDMWALRQPKSPPFWAGLKFFNVYGPNEYHKGRMASVVFHAFNQIQQNGSLKLFKSHRPDYADGEQKRDFIYVKDLVDVILFLLNGKVESGIYNLGSGQARSFLDLGKAVFRAMGLEPEIAFVDTPEDIRDKYQYFTQANMDKLRSQGYTKPFTPLEAGIKDYVKEFLAKGRFL